MQRSELPYLCHMVDAVERLQSHLEGVDRTDFDSDLIRQDAVVRQLEILGEAAGRVSRSLAAASSEIPWAKITGMRHKLIHDYFFVDWDVVWVTATVEVPELLPKLRALIVRLEEATDSE